MSLRLSLLNLGARILVRPRLNRVRTPEEARRDFDRSTGWLLFGPQGVGRAWIDLGGVPALDLRPAGAGDAPLVLYFHGGGYVVGRPETHAKMLSRLARLAGLRVVAPRYRLAPEHPFPAAFEDALSAWNALLGTGVAADRIVLGGDSAGGGLALALLAHLARRGTPPAGTFAFSPWTDLKLTGPSLEKNSATDVFLPVERIEELTGYVMGGGNPGDPRVSPLYAGFSGATPVYIQYSDCEILRDDATRMAAHLTGEGVIVRTDRWPDTPHGWQLLDGWLPESRAALKLAAAFVGDRLRSGPPRSGS